MCNLYARNMTRNMTEQSTFIVGSYNDTIPDYVFNYADENRSNTNAKFMTHCYESQHCNPCHYDYKFVIDGIVLFIVAIFGISGTLMSIAVLFKPQLQNSFIKLLTFLCIFDCTFLILAILSISIPSLSCWCKEKLFSGMHILQGLIHIARTGSVYVTIAVTIERYFAVVQPVKEFKMKVILLPFAIIFAVLYNIPKFFELELRPFYDEGHGTNDTWLCKTNLRIKPYYATIYVFWSKLIIMEIIPYGLIMSLNGCIVFSIVKSNKFKDRNSKIKSQTNGEGETILSSRSNVRNEERRQFEIDMAITLLAISFMFVFCQSIKLVADVYEHSVCDHFKIAAKGFDQSCHNPKEIDILISMGNLFCCINSAANFLVYIIKGKNFRKAFFDKYFYFCKKDTHRQDAFLMYDNNGLAQENL